MKTIVRLVVRLTPEEKAAVLQKAKQAGLTVSEYARRRIEEPGIAGGEGSHHGLDALLKASEAVVPRMISSLDNAIAVTNALHEKINDHAARLSKIETTIKG